MSDAYELFVLYYMAWHDKEFPLAEMKQTLISELGQAGFDAALAEFKSARLERETKGDYRTLCKILEK